jgi:hypothetical protein
MHVDAKAERIINAEGNQQLDITGVVIPFGHSPVLLEGPGVSYNAKITHIASSGGFVSFALSIEATAPAPEPAAVDPEPEPVVPAATEPEIDSSKPVALKNLRVTSN